MSLQSQINIQMTDETKRSSFNLSRDNVTSLHLGRLTPVNFTPLLPQDSIKTKMDFDTLFMPTAYPLMSGLKQYYLTYAVPVAGLHGGVSTLRKKITNVVSPESSFNPEFHSFDVLHSLFNCIRTSISTESDASAFVDKVLAFKHVNLNDSSSAYANVMLLYPSFTEGVPAGSETLATSLVSTQWLATASSYGLTVKEYFKNLAKIFADCFFTPYFHSGSDPRGCLLLYPYYYNTTPLDSSTSVSYKGYNPQQMKSNAWAHYNFNVTNVPNLEGFDHGLRYQSLVPFVDLRLLSSTLLNSSGVVTNYGVGHMHLCHLFYYWCLEYLCDQYESLDVYSDLIKNMWSGSIYQDSTFELGILLNSVPERYFGKGGTITQPRGSVSAEGGYFMSSGSYNSLAYGSLKGGLSHSNFAWKIADQMGVKTPLTGAMQEFYSFLFGKGSNYANLGYPRYDENSNPIFTNYYNFDCSTCQLDFNYRTPSYDFTSCFHTTPSALFMSEKSFNVLPLRALYSIWYFYHRNEHLETRCFDANNFTFSFEETEIDFSEFFYLFAPRFINWQDDIFSQAITSDECLSIFRLESDGQSQSVSPDGTQHSPDVGRFLLNSVLFSGVSLGDNGSMNLNALKVQDVLSRVLQRIASRANNWIAQYKDIYGVDLSSKLTSVPILVNSGSKVVDSKANINNTTVALGDQISDYAGSMSGTSTAVFKHDKLESFFADQDYYLITLTVIRPQAFYPQGIESEVFKFNIQDYPLPAISRFGISYLRNWMLCSSTSKAILANNDLDNPFGYTAPYAEYKGTFNIVSGDVLDSYNRFVICKNNGVLGSIPKFDYRFVHCTPDEDNFLRDNSKQGVCVCNTSLTLYIDRNLTARTDGMIITNG